MPCCGDREKGAPVALEEQWDYINLSDFKSESCLSPFSYFWLYVFLLVSLAVYGVDTFTAVNLLAFSHWAGQIEPAIPFTISRWIFAVCIIISFVLLILRWMRAIRAMRSGSIAQSYLDSLAVRIQSIRPGENGRGWRRFLVFAELTKSKKGAEYVALFAYFSFETWMNTIFADGPRQVVNAITLYSVMKMDLLPGGKNVSNDDQSSGAGQFFDNVKILAEDNTLRALVLCGMVFTVVIWVLSMIKLLLAIILYLIFLFHHIPAQDGTLKAYCRRKINQRLTRIVRTKVNKALAKGVALQERSPSQTLGLNNKPTLPSLAPDDKGPVVATISRSTTQTTLPPYTSRPGTAAPDQDPKLPDVGVFERPALSRTATESSAYSESASLSGTTAVSGYSPLDRQTSPAPPVPPLPSQIPLPASRSQTPMTRPNFTPAPPPSMPSRMASANGFRDPAEANGAYGAYSAYTPHNDVTSPMNGGQYRPFSPAVDPMTRSLTPGKAISPQEYPPPRTFSPAPAAYPYRTYSPSPQAAPQNPFDGAAMRTFSPVNAPGASRTPQSTGYGAYSSVRGSPAPGTGTDTPNRGYSRPFNRPEHF